MGFDEPEEGVEKASEGVYEKQSISKIHMNAVVGVETGNKVIWMHNRIRMHRSMRQSANIKK